MGLGRALLQDLVQLRTAGTITGLDRVIEIGAQQLSNSFLNAHDLLQDIFKVYGRPAIELGAPIYEGTIAGQAMGETLDHQSEQAPPSRMFWEALGFTYAALDFDGHLNSIPLDLNRDAVTPKLKGQFHIAINAGTTEHVANQDNAFRVIHDLVCKGGIMIHEVPAQGMMNHGLVNYNPKFFWHLCRENEYEVLSLRVSSNMASPLPDNITESNKRYGGTPHPLISERIAVAIPDFTINAVLRKRNNKDFVTPMDLPPIKPKG